MSLPGQPPADRPLLSYGRRAPHRRPWVAVIVLIVSVGWFYREIGHAVAERYHVWCLYRDPIACGGNGALGGEIVARTDGSSAEVADVFSEW